MKKSLNIILIILGIIVILVGIDIGSILLKNKPIFAIKDDCDCADQIYRGLFYDIYNCLEYSTPQIKAKWDNFNCSNFKVQTNETDGGWNNGS